MDMTPRVYVWGFTDDERSRFSTFVSEMGVSRCEAIEPDQGNLMVHEILFSDKTGPEPLQVDAKVVLFFNCQAETIHAIMKNAKTRDLPQPIYAMVTRENVDWRFGDLVEHLKKEHEFVLRRMRQHKEEA
ncbi:MAG TPA: DUF3783 domain-containing protein [Deltaproteobacteria bacterium]|nr:DUF3783 domain-containing protein [Deltaproteobacteria bacterium]HOM28453.1 DUF3783 domain-containing protein [Deltaproteobacteria bacterium]HPP79670.1 DUF3783 domain-containing protein [Deltaproteobacteria bacterium]